MVKLPRGWKKVRDTPTLITYVRKRTSPRGIVGYEGVISLKKYKNVWNIETAIRDTKGEVWEDYEKPITLSKEKAKKEAIKLMRRYIK